MNPVLLDLGLIKIYWYSLFIFLGFLIGGYLVLRESKKFNVPEDFMINYFFWLIPIAIIGARLYYVVFNWKYYSGDLSAIFKIWEGGLAIHGGLIFAIIFTFLYTRKYKVPFLLLLDFMVVGLIIGQCIGRWGNFFNGEAHGSIVAYSTLKKLFIPEFIIKGMYIGGNYYHPTFLYESLWCLIGLIFLLVFRRLKYTKVGQVFAMYMVWYGFGRFFIEILRTDSLMIGPVKVAQIISFLMVVCGLVVYIVVGHGSKFNNLYGDTEALNIKY